ncbi:MAG: polynucleotide adenylyltransferase [Deltaproteobacteria bacterium]|nr:MAG: polynucleotide adenylyltransferase [Deltaproteobacteria bacterium]
MRIPSYVRKVVARLRAAGYEAFPVGGAVRDLLLGRRSADWDVTTNARPEQTGKLFAHTVPTGLQHGTVCVLVGRQAVEVTTYRGDIGYSDGRHPDQVVFLDSLAEDLKRRDFTINAMALDLDSGRIIDPFGGRRDLRRRLIRAVGDADKRFAEDGLRPLRAVRFAGVLDFSIEKKTFAAIDRARDTFRQVAPERIQQELVKMLAARRADRAVELLRKSGLLAEILPELLPGVGFAQNSFHRHDVYRHTLACLRHAHGDGVFKLAVLLHDVGKPQVAEGEPGQRTFYRHEQVSAEMAGRIMRRLRFANRDRERVVALIKNHMFHYEPGWTDGAVRRLVRRAGVQLLDELWELRRADAWGRGPGLRAALANLRQLQARVEEVLAEDAALKVSDLAIDGNDVMRVLGCPPGPQVGQVLERLLEFVLDDPQLNQRRRLLKLVRECGR